MGIPSEPGGTLLDCLVLLSRKRIGISKRRATRRILFMVQDFVFQVMEYPHIRVFYIDAFIRGLDIFFHTLIGVFN
jgi:hypothetical protein